jgi:hypothetical protein
VIRVFMSDRRRTGQAGPGDQLSQIQAIQQCAVRQFFSNSTYFETKKAKAQRERLVGLA